jgi:FemAB-related protein (PEP-CTERM system-associated)
MTIIKLTTDNETRWDQYVLNSEHANFYHLLGWKRVFQQTFGYQQHYLLALADSGAVEGVLPMLRMTDIFRRKYLVSNPFSNFAGLCADSAAVAQGLLTAAAEEVSAAGAQYAEFRQLEHRLQIGNLPAKESFVTLMLNLSEDPEEIWNAISSRNRGKVRKAEKGGLVPDFGMKYLKAFHQVYSVNLRHLGTPIFPLRMFERVAEEFGDRVELLVLKLDGQVVSGMFLFKFKKMISEPWVASLREYNRIYINNYLYWQAIKYACNEGFEIFDFGRSTVDTGTYEFKLQWGAKPIPLYYHYHLNKAKQIPVVDAKDNKYQRAIDLWKKLPQALTDFAGPRLVRFLPEL